MHVIISDLKAKWKKKLISESHTAGHWWFTPVILATWKAEIRSGELQFKARQGK
jgi:hypothetical protein